MNNKALNEILTQNLIDFEREAMIIWEAKAKAVFEQIEALNLSLEEGMMMRNKAAEILGFAKPLVDVALGNLDD